MPKQKVLLFILMAFTLLFPFQAALAQTAEGASPQTDGAIKKAPQAMEQDQTSAVETDIEAGAAEIVENATRVFKEIMDMPEANIPPEILNNAEAIVIIPSLIKAGFIAAGRHGTGVMLNHQEQGWSPPIFVSITGASVGAQLGVQSSDVVLVFNNQEKIGELLQGNDLTLGVDASVSAGPAGTAIGATTKDAEIFSYKRSEGLFAGVSVTGGVITLDQSATMAYYNIDPQQVRGYYKNETQMMQTILRTEGGKEEFTQQVPQSAEELQQVLSQYTQETQASQARQQPVQPDVSQQDRQQKAVETTTPSQTETPAQAGTSSQAVKPSQAGTPLFISPVSLAAIQSKLQELGFDPDQIDGQWGKKTAQAIKEFQTKQQLAPTGNLNIETIAQLDMPQVLKGAVEHTGTLQADRISSQKGTQLYISPASVRQIQEKLAQKDVYNDDIDGVWNSVTRQAIQDYEQQAGMQRSGQITIELINSLELTQLTAGLVGVGSPEVVAQDRQLQIFEKQPETGQTEQEQAAAQKPEQEQVNARGYYGSMENISGADGAPLYVGSQAVKDIQRELKRSGFDPGPMDGIWGSGTQQALKEFQQARSLEPTGNLNITTYRILAGGFGVDQTIQDQMGETAPDQN